MKKNILNTTKNNSNDEKYIRECIKLAEKSIKQGEYPFGCIAVLDNKIIARSINKTNQTKDITRHAEMNVLLKIQKKLSSEEIERCTIYTNCEPCPMCGFVMREMKIKRVVYALSSPYMGAKTRWNILSSRLLAKLSPVYNGPIKVTGNILKDEARETFSKIGWGKMLNKSFKNN